jgi:hypothetical protein
MIKIKIIIIALLLVAVFGCRNVPKTNEPVAEDSKELEMDQLEVDVKEIYYRFPSPDEMLNFIDKEKLSFNNRYLLPVNNSKSYLDSKSQALNLGIYIADMAYISLFQRQKEIFEYFQVIYGLSDKLRISSAFDINLMKRFEDNLKNVDSMRVLTDIAMTNITNYLVQNDKEKTFALISIGGYVESLYLAFNLVGGYNEKSLIIQRISDQKLVLENLMGYSLKYSGDPNVAESIKLLHPIRACYNELVVKESETTVKKDNSGKLIISGGQMITITPEQYQKLKDVTFAVRKSITENLEN